MSHMSATTHRKENSFWLQGLNGESSVLTAPQTGFVSPLSLLALGNLPERTVTSALSSTAMWELRNTLIWDKVQERQDELVKKWYNSCGWHSCPQNCVPVTLVGWSGGKKILSALTYKLPWRQESSFSEVFLSKTQRRIETNGKVVAESVQWWTVRDKSFLDPAWIVLWVCHETNYTYGGWKYLSIKTAHPHASDITLFTAKPKFNTKQWRVSPY